MTRISIAHRSDIASGADKIVRVARTVLAVTSGPGQMMIADQTQPADVQPQPQA